VTPHYFTVTSRFALGAHQGVAAAGLSPFITASAVHRWPHRTWSLNGLTVAAADVRLAQTGNVARGAPEAAAHHVRTPRFSSVWPRPKAELVGADRTDVRWNQRNAVGCL
jgi:hypothetical protein